MARLFGTDGVRGIAGPELSGDLAYRLGRAAVIALAEQGETRPSVVVGRDTRASGEFLEAALAAGICSAGGDAVLLEVCTTPGVAFLTAALGAQAGAVISASHNPPEYNGVKFFASTGFKLPDDVEDEMERLVSVDDGPRPSGRGVGRIRTAADARERYLDHLAAAAEASLEGMDVVVDSANGAASGFAEALLSRLGARVTAIHDGPDGWNINDGSGATEPNVVAATVREAGADAGVALDGDADRAIFADAEGSVVDGDQTLAACAADLMEHGRLPGGRVVTTVMANVGFRVAMRDAGIEVEETKVGDRYVLEAMRRTGAVLGGEQSGHVIFLDQATTGDGLLTAVRFLSLAARSGRTVADLASIVRKFPQVLLNVPADPAALEGAEPVWEAVRAAEDALGERGRVLVRGSGTEPLVRVMVEADTEDEARSHAEAVAASVRAALG
jgi:phosphoglucosamine mutase